MMPVPLPKTIVSPVLQLPPICDPPTFVTVTGEPPLAATFRNSPGTKKAIHCLTGATHTG